MIERFILLLEDADEAVETEVVVADEVFEVAVAITAVVAVGTATLEMAEAADRLASPNIDQAFMSKRQSHVSCNESDSGHLGGLLRNI